MKNIKGDGMLTFILFDKIGRTAEEITDNELYKREQKGIIYDKREFDIIPKHKYYDKSPLATVPLIHEKIFFPVFKTTDLNKLFISKTGHLMLKESLSVEQQVWLYHNQESYSLFMREKENV